MKETTYIMVKPGFANNDSVIKEVLKRLTDANLTVKKQGFVKYNKQAAKLHYAEHIGKSFYQELEDYITSDKAFAIIVSGENAVNVVRALCGKTRDPEAGTLRYDIPTKLGLPIRVTENVVHSSDSEASAEREIAIVSKLFDVERKI